MVTVRGASSPPCTDESPICTPQSNSWKAGSEIWSLSESCWNCPGAKKSCTAATVAGSPPSVTPDIANWLPSDGAELPILLTGMSSGTTFWRTVSWPMGCTMMSVSAGGSPRSVTACSVPGGSCADQLPGVVSAVFSCGSTATAGSLTPFSGPQVALTFTPTEKKRKWRDAVPFRCQGLTPDSSASSSMPSRVAPSYWTSTPAEKSMSKPNGLNVNSAS